MSEHDTTQDNTYPEVMTSAQAMSFLNMGRSAFYKALRAGEIPCRRYSQRMIRFSRTALTADVATATTSRVEQGPPPLLKNELQKTPATPATKPKSRQHAITGEIVTDAGSVPGRRLTPEQRDIAKRAYLADVNCGGVLKDAARDAGVTMGTVRAWREADKDFAHAEQACRISDIENEDEDDGSYMPGMSEQEIHDMVNGSDDSL